MSELESLETRSPAWFIGIDSGKGVGILGLSVQWQASEYTLTQGFLLSGTSGKGLSRVLQAHNIKSSALRIQMSIMQSQEGVLLQHTSRRLIQEASSTLLVACVVGITGYAEVSFEQLPWTIRNTTHWRAWSPVGNGVCTNHFSYCIIILLWGKFGRWTSLWYRKGCKGDRELLYKTATYALVHSEYKTIQTEQMKEHNYDLNKIAHILWCSSSKGLARFNGWHPNSYQERSLITDEYG